MTQLLYRSIPSQRIQNNNPIKKIFPTLINSLNILKQRINNLKHTNRRITPMIILIPKRTSQVQVEKNISDKNHNLKHTNRSITHKIILPSKIMSQVQVTTKMNMMKNQYINMENQLIILIIKTQIQTQKVIIYKVALHILQLNIMFTMNTFHLLTR